MQYYSKATLVYVGKTTDEKGSPQEVTFTREVKAKEIKRFSDDFYTTSGVKQQELRGTRNLTVPTWLTEDVVQDGIRYELTYVDYATKFGADRYRVHRVREYFKTSLQMILILVELR